MSIPLKDFRASVWSLQDKGTYAQVNMSTSRKDKKTEEYANSSWYANFVGEAYKNIDELSERGTRILVKSGTLKKEPYMDKDGVRQYPKNPTMTVFAWEKYVPDPNFDSPPRVEEEVPPPTQDEFDSDELPF